MNTEPSTRVGPEQLLTEYYGLEAKRPAACFSGECETLSVPQFSQLHNGDTSIATSWNYDEHQMS